MRTGNLECADAQRSATKETLATKGTQEIYQIYSKSNKLIGLEKNKKEPFLMFVALVRAIVISGFGVSLRTGSYAMPITLIT